MTASTIPTYTIDHIFNRTTSYYAVKDAAGKFVTVDGTRTRQKFWTEGDAAAYITEFLAGQVGETTFTGSAVATAAPAPAESLSDDEAAYLEFCGIPAPTTYTGSDGRQYTVPDEEHTSDPARRQYSYMHIQSFEDGSVMVTFSLHGWTAPERDSFGSLAEAIEEHPLILTILTDGDGNA